MSYMTFLLVYAAVAENFCICNIQKIRQCMEWNVKKLKLFGIKGLCNQKRWKPVRGGLTYYVHEPHARYEKNFSFRKIYSKNKLSKHVENLLQVEKSITF